MPLLALALVAPMFGACGSDDSPAVEDDAAATTTTEAAGRPVVEMKEYSITMPAELEGGLNTLDVKNTGKESHALLLVRLDDGKTKDDFLKALEASEQGPPPAFAHDSGGAANQPSETNELSLNLEKGTYVAYCPVPGPDGAPHFAKGMATQFAVGEGAPGDLEGEDYTITAKDFTWDGLDKVKAGENTVKFVNEGPENHEAAFAELVPGKTADDLIKFFSSNGPPTGPPPFVGFGAFGLQAPKGFESVTKLTLKPNTTYAVLCFVGNKKGPHFQQGMLKEIKTGA